MPRVDELMLRETCEKIRNLPIDLAPPVKEIPCVETSDKERLCRNPVVSVCMTVYNHEKYVREAIEGVLMQKTDFEYELVIGEDASTDKSREICFEYQKKNPEKVRVLWSESNVYKMDGNGTRIIANCKGEFVAICEGDDFWNDPYKLQKQVEVMRKNPNVGLCMTRANLMNEVNGWIGVYEGRGFPKGYINGRNFFLLYCYGKTPALRVMGETSMVQTATLMIRRSVLNEGLQKFEIFRWLLTVGDAKIVLCGAALADVYFLEDITATYRHNAGGVSCTVGTLVTLDGLLIRIAFGIQVLGLAPEVAIRLMRRFFIYCILHEAKNLPPCAQRLRAKEIRNEPTVRRFFHSVTGQLVLVTMRLGWLNRRTAYGLHQLVCRLSLPLLRNPLVKIYRDTFAK